MFYHPKGSFAGDVIPFYWEEKYHLFHILPDSGWMHIVTTDFVNFEELGEALPRGGADDQDADIWTGSVIERDSVFHIFYTGHNDRFPAKGGCDQVIMHAVSTDLLAWTKDPGFAIPPPINKGYERSAWRDSFVFWNDEAKEYWMLVTARSSTDIPVHRRGCIALLASPDLENWELRDPLWAPENCDTQECPDMFRIGEWWYLVYSTYAGKWATHYRMSKSLSGPWLAAPVEMFDGNGYYAAKTASDGNRRYVIGWLCNRPEDSDKNPFVWGGTVVAHEIRQQTDGSLSANIPDGVAAAFTQEQSIYPAAITGEWNILNGRISTQSLGRFSILRIGEVPKTCIIKAKITFSEETLGCGLMLRGDASFDNSYQLLLDPSKHRILFYRDGESPVERFFEQERAIDLQPNETVDLCVVIDESIIVIYVNEVIALSGRMYDLTESNIALFASNGNVIFSDVCICTTSFNCCD